MKSPPKDNMNAVNGCASHSSKTSLDAAAPRTLHSRGGGNSSATPTLTVIIPVYNEERTIHELLCRVLWAPYDKEIIVVDDASTDGTAKILNQWRDNRHVTLLKHDFNRGKGAAVRTGLLLARGRFTIIQDADLEYDPADYPKMLEPLLAGGADVVYGSRYLAPTKRLSGFLRLGLGTLNFAVRTLYGAKLTDMFTCYTVLPTSLARGLDLHSDRFTLGPEITAKLCKMGAKIHEVPIQYSSRSRKSGERSRLKDGWAALKALWRWRHWRKEGVTFSS